MESVSRRFLQAPVNDAFEGLPFRYDARVGDPNLIQSRRLGLKDSSDGRGRIGSGERMGAGAKLEEDDAESKQVRTRVNGLAADLLGRHVGRRPELGAGVGQVCERRVVEAGETEIENLDLPIGRSDDILRLEIAMDDAPLVGRRQGLGHLRRRLDDVRDRKRATPQLFAECFAGDVLEGDEQVMIEFLQGVDRGDARMRQRGRGSGLAAQTLASCRVVSVPRCQRLEGHRPAQPDVVGEVHDAHATLAEHAGDSIMAQRLAHERVGHALRECSDSGRRDRRPFNEIGGAVVRGEK